MITNNLKKVKCAFCGKEFFRRKEQFNEAKKFGWKQYCSPECLSKSRTKKQMLVCENCGKRFSRVLNAISLHNYCSRSCAAKVNNKKYPKRQAKLRICIKCGTKFRKNTNNIKYCSLSCRRKAEQRIPEELIKIIKETAKKLKRAPAKREINTIQDSCRRIFGSWNNAILAAGLQPNRLDSQRMYKRTSTVALDGHFCDSISEFLIDNWLYKNKILHERNAHYPKTHHKADWAIIIEKQKIFVEYFGLANDSPRYDRAIKEKRKLCHKNKIPLIAIYPRDIYPKEFLEKSLQNKFKKILTI
jgi:hypothetical protein